MEGGEGKHKAWDRGLIASEGHENLELEKAVLGIGWPAN